MTLKTHKGAVIRIVENRKPYTMIGKEKNHVRG